MKTSQHGIDLIKEYEGFRARAYRDPVGYTKRPLASLVASTRF